MPTDIPRIAEIMQAPLLSAFRDSVNYCRINGLRFSPMDYKEEIGRRIRLTREDKGLTLAELSQKTDDVLTGKRINAYENGDRMPGPAEAVILAKALGVRPAYLMVVDDVQTPITPQEEALVRNWRTLSERERMDIFRKIQTMALSARDPVQDQIVERHIPQLDRPDKVKKKA